MSHPSPARILGSLLVLIALSGVSSAAFAAGGAVALRTDNGWDGYYYGLDGSGVDRYINTYLAHSFRPETIICGARWRELNRGVPLPGTGDGDIRLEDPGNPEYPDIVGGLVATVDAASRGTCDSNGVTPRIFTFGAGAGIPDPVVTHFISAIEPLHGTGMFDFCGTLLDTSSAHQSSAKYYSGGRFGTVRWNHFIEEIVFTGKRMELNVLASGSARYPGDRGIPVVFTTRANGTGAVTDDNITLTIVIDNNTGGSIGRTVRICADLSVVDPKKGLKDITDYFRPVGGGSPIMNPLTLPYGRTILHLEVASTSVKSKAAGIVDGRVLNLPLRVLVDEPMLDTNACALDGGVDTREETRDLGLRRRAGSFDDNSAEGFVGGFAGNCGLWFRAPCERMPSAPFTFTGFELVGGEFGGSGLPGFDCIELRTEDPVFAGNPDLSNIGLLRSVGVRDGVGEVPLGPPPTTRVFDVADFAFGGNRVSTYAICWCDPTPSAAFTAIGSDTTTATTLGLSAILLDDVLPGTYVPDNFMIRMLLDGDRSTLSEGVDFATMAPNAFAWDHVTFIAIDKSGRRLR